MTVKHSVRFFAACLSLSLGFAGASAALDAKPDAKVTPLMEKPLASAGSAEKDGVMLLVEYPPGGSTAEHRHNADVFVYVLQGSIVMQVKGGEEVTLQPGQSFHEAREDIHVVSRNASETEPAKFVVFLVKDKGAPPVVPVK